MERQQTALRKLLAGELPLDRVGPHLRQAARRALRSGDPERLRLVTQVVVGELLRRGDLLRIAIEQPAAGQASAGPICLLKGTNRVVDLSVLGGDTSSFNFPADLRPLNSPATGAQPADTPYSLSDFAGMLGAMEDAQDLEIGAPQSGDKSVILAGILRLLRKFTPQFRLFIMLDEAEAIHEGAQGIFQVPAEAARGNWISLRDEGHSVWIPSPGELPNHILEQTAAEEQGAFELTAAVAVPLWEPMANGTPVDQRREAGLVFVATRDDLGREPLLRLADRLARFVTRRWQHQQEVNQRIHTDSLTGVFNRAFFDSQFTLELERARRSEVPLTLVIADLDHFKKVNDELGHQIGDRALQMVARRLQEELRRIDHICRIGGEEFALILPDTGQEAGQEVLGRLLDAPFIEEVVHENRNIDLRVTFSFGAVTFPAAGSDAFELYRKADAMLYLSKDLGRNQCHFWNTLGEHVRIQPSTPTT
ncbi:MAG: GGDEF domain-containing protein [Candidatus Krumholzibacteria bacterium]|nr:GGDEF domain-containing protein [Candidatus Krumholzibacteria bacterium]